MTALPQESACQFSVYMHDAVTGQKSQRSVIYPALEKVFGKGGFCTHAAPPCRKPTGETKQTTYVRNGKEITATYKVTKPCDPCECKFGKLEMASCSPDLNPAENGQNQLRQVVEALVKDEDSSWSWSGSVQKKMKLLEHAIKILDADKDYWKKLFGAQRGRYREVATSGGELHKN